MLLQDICPCEADIMSKGLDVPSNFSLRSHIVRFSVPIKRYGNNVSGTLMGVSNTGGMKNHCISKIVKTNIIYKVNEGN